MPALFKAKAMEVRKEGICCVVLKKKKKNTNKNTPISRIHF